MLEMVVSYKLTYSRIYPNQGMTIDHFKNRRGSDVSLYDEKLSQVDMLGRNRPSKRQKNGST